MNNGLSAEHACKFGVEEPEDKGFLQKISGRKRSSNFFPEFV